MRRATPPVPKDEQGRSYLHIREFGAVLPVFIGPYQGGQGAGQGHERRTGQVRSIHGKAVLPEQPDPLVNGHPVEACKQPISQKDTILVVQSGLMWSLLPRQTISLVRLL